MFVSVFNTGSHYVDQDGLELRDLPASCFWSTVNKGNAQPHPLRVNFLYFEVIIESLHLRGGGHACVWIQVPLYLCGG